MATIGNQEQFGSLKWQFIRGFIQLIPAAFGLPQRSTG
jgi:hypothetical protein